MRKNKTYDLVHIFCYRFITSKYFKVRFFRDFKGCADARKIFDFTVAGFGIKAFYIALFTLFKRSVHKNFYKIISTDN